MSKTLKLIDRLLTMGRNFQALERHREALRLLGRLAAFRELPADVAEETQVRLAELWLRRRKHQRARGTWPPPCSIVPTALAIMI